MHKFSTAKNDDILIVDIIISSKLLLTVIHELNLIIRVSIQISYSYWISKEMPNGISWLFVTMSSSHQTLISPGCSPKALPCTSSWVASLWQKAPFTGERFGIYSRFTNNPWLFIAARAWRSWSNGTKLSAYSFGSSYATYQVSYAWLRYGTCGYSSVSYGWIDRRNA